VFQSYALFPHMTRPEHRLWSEMRGVAKPEQTKRSPTRSRSSGGGFLRPLSAADVGGQQQRVALARALVIKPDVLLLDERSPISTPSCAKEMQVELRQIQRTSAPQPFSSPISG